MKKWNNTIHIGCYHARMMSVIESMFVSVMNLLDLGNTLLIQLQQLCPFIFCLSTMLCYNLRRLLQLVWSWGSFICPPSLSWTSACFIQLTQRPLLELYPAFPLSQMLLHPSTRIPVTFPGFLFSKIKRKTL